jgi:hypothetical protein
MLRNQTSGTALPTCEIFTFIRESSFDRILCPLRFRCPSNLLHCDQFRVSPRNGRIPSLQARKMLLKRGVGLVRKFAAFWKRTTFVTRFVVRNP